MSFYDGYPEYVSVAERKKKAEKRLKKLSKKGKILNPIQVYNKKLVTTELGKSWCTNVEQEIAYCTSRLSKGRSYLRHGSVIHLDISEGKIEAIVSGTDIYKIEIKVKPLKAKIWEAIKNSCIEKPDVMFQLFKGELSTELAQVFCNQKHSIFPMYNEVDLKCNCYDFFGDVCKHIAAVLYGVGAIIDNNIKQLFLLRGMNYEDLLAGYANQINQDSHQLTSNNIIEENCLENLFGVELI